MKTIKIIFSFILFTFTILSCTEESKIKNNTKKEKVSKDAIGFKDDNKFKFYEKEKFKTNWENELKENGFEIKITDFTIETIDMQNNGEVLEYIVGYNVDKSVKTAKSISLKEGEYVVNSNKGTVTCTGCRDGCDPKDLGDRWICTACNIYASSCTKSVTVPVPGD
jgi:hypothetical protein